MWTKQIIRHTIQEYYFLWCKQKGEKKKKENEKEKEKEKEKDKQQLTFYP